MVVKLIKGRLAWTRVADRFLDRAIKVTLGLVIVAFASFVIYYVRDNYFRPGPSALERTIEHMEELVRANPADPNVRLAVADVYLANRMYDEAITQYNEVLAAVEDHKGAIFGLGSAYMALKQDDLAIDYLNKVIELSAESEMARLDTQLQTSHYYLGQIYIDAGELDLATQHLEKAVALNPIDADALYALAGAYQEKATYAEAAEAYGRTVALVPDFKEAYESMAQCYQALGDEALASYASGMVAMLNGDYADAISKLESAVESKPDVAHAFWGLGTAYEMTGQREKALAAYQQALAIDPEHILTLMSLDRLEQTSP